MTDTVSFDFGLLANFVHQVINPLNGVSGTLDNLIDGTISDEYRREQRLRAARAQLEHSIMLVRNLAYFSEISIDPRNTNPSKIRKTCVIPQIIIEAAMFFQELAESRDIKIHLEDRVTQYITEGNPDLLRQVFMNMFDNAVKYSDPGSTVSIKPRIQKKSSNLIISIENRGAAIEYCDRERVFELGFRGPEAKARIASGTGLGLYICRTIIKEVHGGEITLESDARAGRNEFFIKFPKWSIQ
ncbi:MAG TPA: HAMP domain-containing sensor histidine kinase [Kaistia sp.]|nr:HAMP domain-containing sensor histidine kinase [Kaistia sp.]